MKALIGSLASVALAGAASAQITAFNIDSNPATTTGGANVVTNVLSIDFTGQYTGSQILVQLDSGSIFNTDLFGADQNFAPNQGAIDNVNADLALDTFLAQGGPRNTDNVGGEPALGGGAVNIDNTEVSAVFNDATKISQAYNPAAGQFVEDQSNFATAQLTFSDDANGTFAYFASANGEFYWTTQGNVDATAGGIQIYEVRSGVIQEIPEPASAALLGLGGLAMLRRRSA